MSYRWPLGAVNPMKVNRHLNVKPYMPFICLPLYFWGRRYPYGSVYDHSSDRSGVEPVRPRERTGQKGETLMIWSLGVYLILLLAFAVPAGWWLCKVMMRPADSCGGDWKAYAKSLILFHAAGVFFLYGMLRMQGFLPLNPQHVSGLAPNLAFNTAVSFVTNTNWQAYAGESAVSYLSQMAGLAVQNFLSAAVGISVAFALMRSFICNGDGQIGDFYTDVRRAVFGILLPLSFVSALLFVHWGVPQTWDPAVSVRGMDDSVQTIPFGPVASQEAIKMLGTNGGGFFNANSAHPFENPSPVSNLAQMLLIFLIPAGLVFAFGRVVKDRRQGMTLLASMLILFIVAAIFTMHAESAAHIWEGKETRFGFLDSSLFAVITTSASCGAVNAMLSSFSAVGGLIPLWLMQMGEVVFGGVGSGFYGMILFVLLAVFLAGLMVGRTPEYLGKKIGPYEMKMVAFAILIGPVLVLAGTAVAVNVPIAVNAVLNPGPHGLTEILYAFSSAANNNGSAFAGLSVNNLFWNVALGVCMWFGRFGTILPVLAIAGSLAAKKPVPESAGTLPTHGPLFVVFLCLTVLLMGALTYFPVLALSPIAEALGHIHGGF
jgi:potassium-transporting ATPase potassium-binding subunit